MTTFFTIVAVVHVVGLYALLLAMRRAPVAAQGEQGFRVITEADEAHEIVTAHARTA